MENQARGDVCDICGHTVAMKLKYNVDECQERGMTYAVPLKVTIRLVVWNKDPETGVRPSATSRSRRSISATSR